MWKRESYEIATPKGSMSVEGVTQSGLGMHFVRKQEHLLQPPPAIAITHLGSGHTVCIVEAQLDRAAQVATEIMSLGPWDFDGLEGYKNMAPDLIERLMAVLDRHADVVRSAETKGQDPKQARHIAAARW